MYVLATMESGMVPTGRCGESLLSVSPAGRLFGSFAPGATISPVHVRGALSPLLRHFRLAHVENKCEL